MRILPTVACALIGIAIGGSGSYVLEKMKMPRVHKLQFPLALSGGTSNSPTSILRKGHRYIMIKPFRRVLFDTKFTSMWKGLN